MFSFFSGHVLWAFFFLICRIIHVFDYLVFIKAFVYFNVTENATENSSAFLRNT
jgi:hypothetical protein